MKKKIKNDQHKFWSGKFGNEYIARNNNENLISSNIYLFIQALKKIDKIKNLIEFGANIGLNIKALKILFPKLDTHTVEINSKACKQLAKLMPKKNIFNNSIENFVVKQKFDLVLIKGVLIHVNPKELIKVYKKLYDASKKYLLIVEYYNPDPISVTYRGHSEKLFKRDFAGEMIKKYPKLRLVDYGFVYRGDINFPQDDLTWFLIEKNNVKKRKKK